MTIYYLVDNAGESVSIRATFLPFLNHGAIPSVRHALSISKQIFYAMIPLYESYSTVFSLVMETTYTEKNEDKGRRAFSPLRH